MKIFDKKYKISGSTSNLQHYQGPLGAKAYSGAVITPHGFVIVNSETDHALYHEGTFTTFFRICISGVLFHRSIQHSKPYTEIGLVRMAGRFASDCAEEWKKPDPR